MRRAQRIRVVVIADHDAETITDCLDGVAEQGAGRADVVVVDLDSADDGADVAIHHPVPGRVVVTAPGSLDRVLTLAADDAPDDRLVVIGADRRPGPGWLDAAEEALGRLDLARPPDGDGRHLALRWSRLQVLSLDAADPEELVCRARTAGAAVGLVVGMAHDAAASGRRRGPRPRVAPEIAARSAPGHRGLVSVVVCTRGRPDQLERCLTSLGALDDDHHEVLVVDNHEAPTVPASVLPPRGRVVHEPRRGLDRARNRAIEEALGDVLAYVDDDCEVDPSWLAGLREALADPAVRGVTGRVRPAALTTPTQRWFEAHFSFDRGWRPQRFTPWDRRPWYPMWAGGIGAGCNMAFRREELIAVGGFDPLLDMGTSIGGGGDLDLLVRVVDRGSLIAYRPDALVWHHHRTTPAELRRQFLGYGVAVGALLTKTVLDRPQHRWTAVRFYIARLQEAARLVRQRRAGAHLVPVPMIVLDVLGQLAGPLVYACARSGGRRRP